MDTTVVSKLNELAKPTDYKSLYILAQQAFENGFRGMTVTELVGYLSNNLPEDLVRSEFIYEQAKPSVPLTNPGRKASMFAPAGTYTTPSGNLTLTEDFNVIGWDGAKWVKMLEVPVEVEAKIPNWTAQPYTVGKQVLHNDQWWEAVLNTTALQEPGVVAETIWKKPIKGIDLKTENMIRSLSAPLSGTYTYKSDLDAAFPIGNNNFYLVTGDVKQLDSLTITGTPTANGSITITLNGVSINVVIDTAIENTPQLVAAKIRNTIFQGWSTGGTGSTVTFTDLSDRVVIPSIFSAGTTGIAATLTLGTKALKTFGEYVDGNWYYWDASTWVSGGKYFLSPDKIKGINIGQLSGNRLDLSTVTRGGYYNSSNVWVNDPLYVFSDYILLEPGVYTTKTTTNFTYHNINKKFIQGGVAGKFNVFDARYIRIAVLLSDIGNYMLIKADPYPSTYTPYNGKFEFDPEVFKFPETGDIAPNKIVGIDKTALSLNLFDKEDVIIGGFYNEFGVWVPNNGQVSANFIPITPGVYRKTSADSYAIYDKDRNFIRGARGALINITEFGLICFSVAVPALNTYMFTPDPYPSSYIPYKKGYTFNPNVFKPLLPEGLEDNSTLIQNKLKTYLGPLELRLPDFSGRNEPIHPSVVYVPGGFQGYKYWLVQTPLPNGLAPYTERWECPVVYKSLDGIIFEVVANPLDDLTPDQIANKDFFSDPHIIYRPDTGELEVWYRFRRQLPSGDVPSTIYRKKTKDGVVWSDREIVYPETLDSSPDFILSPAVIWDGTKYNMWYTNPIGKFYKSSPDAITWSEITPLQFDQMSYAWHIDVNFYKGEYHYIGFYNIGGAEISQSLQYFTSTDGINFTWRKRLLISKLGNELYSTGLYRSVSLLDENGKVRLYFSATRSVGGKRVDLIIVDTLLDVVDVERVNGRYMLSSTGKTLDDLEAEIKALRLLIP